MNKWDKALQGSYAVVSARLISDSRLVGFARATSDRALNGTIWDVVTDPSLPDEVRTCEFENSLAQLLAKAFMAVSEILIMLLCLCGVCTLL